MMQDIASFEDLLLKLQGLDNDARKAAEKKYESLEPAVKFNYLLQVLSNQASTTESKVFSGVLCRRLLDTEYETAFEQLPPETRTLVKQQLLNLTASEPDSQVRRKLTEIIAEVARNHIDENQNQLWPELVQFVFHDCRQNKHFLKTSLHLLSLVPNIFGNQLSVNLQALCAFLAQSMDAQQEMSMREAAVKAYSNFVIHMLTEEEEESLEKGDGSTNAQVGNKPTLQWMPISHELMPLMLNCIRDCLSVEPENDAQMKCLVDIADRGGEFLTPHVGTILDLCIKMLQEARVDESLKKLAIETVVSIAESNPASIRKAHSFIEPFLKLVFQMLSTIEDDEEWGILDDDEQEDDSTLAVTAEMALDRFAIAMKGKRIMDVITATVPSLFRSPNWRERVAGLVIIASCGEGLNKVMGTVLGQIVDEVIPMLRDAHPRVRYAACNAIGQMATDFQPKFQKMHHAKILPSLMAVLDDAENPRVQANAGAALVNFTEEAPKNIISQYLDTMAAKLHAVIQAQIQNLVQNKKKLVLEQMLTTVASLADSVGEKFGVYYDSFMPLLKFLMENTANHEKLRLLRGKTIECISLMGLAVGKEKFTADAEDVMNMLMQAQQRLGSEPLPGGDDGQAVMSSDDPQQSYMVTAWGRICKLLGSNFQPFLPLVMEPVRKMASMKPGVCMYDDEDAEEIDPGQDWQVVKVNNNQNVAINTAGLEDKAMACRILVTYAKELKEGFAEYAADITQLMVPLLKFYFSEEVRSVAAESFSHLLTASKPKGDTITQGLWNQISDGLLAAITTEEDTEVLADLFDALAECVKVIGSNCMPEEKLTKVCELMNSKMEEVIGKQNERAKKQASDDYDEDDEEDIEAQKDLDSNILYRITDLMHAFFIAYKENALSIFRQIVANVMKLMEPKRPPSFLQAALCFWDDLIESTGPISWEYREIFLQPLCQASQHAQADVRQAAFYGIGLIAMHGGDQYKPFLVEIGNILLHAINLPNAREPELNTSTENAISALTKMCRYQPSTIPGNDVDAFLRQWVTWLPVWEDTEEAPHILDFLCELMQQNNCAVLGSSNENLPRIIHAIAYCLKEEALDKGSAVYQRCLNMVHTLQVNASAEIFSACLSNLSDDEKTCLKKALESIAST